MIALVLSIAWLSMIALVLSIASLTMILSFKYSMGNNDSLKLMLSLSTHGC